MHLHRSVSPQHLNPTVVPLRDFYTRSVSGTRAAGIGYLVAFKGGVSTDLTCMGFTLPPAIAGEDNEVSADQEGVMKILRITGGIGIAAMAVGAGLWLKNKVASAAGAEEATSFGMEVA